MAEFFLIFVLYADTPIQQVYVMERAVSKTACKRKQYQLQDLYPQFESDQENRFGCMQLTTPRVPI